MAKSLWRPIVWFYGSSGAGKSDICGSVSEILGGPSIDESAIRRLALPELGWSAVDRHEVALTTAVYAKMASQDTANYPGPAVWVSSEALFAENRLAILSDPAFRVFFVLVDSPMSLCRERAEHPFDLPDRSPAPDLVLSGDFSDLGSALAAWLPGLEQLLGGTK